MRHELYLKASFILILCAWTIIRLYFKVKAGLLHERIFPRTERISFIVLRAMLGIPLFVFIFVHIFLPGRASWSQVHLRLFLRWSGVLVAILALMSLVWVHRALGKNFHTSVVIKKNHQFVREGPYRFVRHPMYSTYFAFFVSLFLISENFVIGLCGVAIILMLMTLRLRYEEALLIERFPNDYPLYRETTAKFIPLRSMRMNSGKKRLSPSEMSEKIEAERRPL